MFSHRRRYGLLLGGVGALALGAAPALASAAPAPQVAVAGAASLGAGTVRVGSVPAGDQIGFRINLAPRDEAGAERYAVAAATPGSAEQGTFLSEAQYQARFGADPVRVAAFKGWLHLRGITVDQTVGNQVLVAHGTAGRVSAAFSTSLAKVSSGGRIRAAAVTPLRVPASYGSLVQGIGGLAAGPTFATTARRGPTLASVPASQTATSAATPSLRGSAAAAALPNDPACPQYFGQTPAVGPHAPYSVSGTSVQECSVFRALGSNQPVLYPGANYQKLHTLANWNARYTGLGVTVGIVLWGDDANAGTSASTGAKANGGPILRAGQFTRVINGARINGCQQVGDDAAGEENLDVQSVHAMAPDATIRYYGSAYCVVPELSLAQALAEKAPPSVLSNSWGTPNQDYVASDPTFRSLHTSMVKAAIRGVTVVFSTGDTGDGTTLRSQYPTVSPNPPYPARTPGYPATDPYVLAVGGVGFGTRANGSVAFKQAWTPQYSVGNGRSPWQTIPANALSPDSPNVIGTSGGTSRAFPAPSWQRPVVGNTGRVVPDVSNAADAFFLPAVVAQRTGNQVVLFNAGGTSLAAPLTAGQVADAVKFQGRRYLGVVTPSLYKLRGSTVVSDVQRAQNAVSVDLGQDTYLLVGGERPHESLITRPGFDNATGLGVPGTGWLGNLGR